MPSENHETAIVDFYYSWGWERTDCSANVIPMPSTKLLGRKIIGADNLRKGILWAATSAYRYVVQYPFIPSHFNEYLSWQQRFAATLPQYIMEDVSFRPHYENYEWGTIERLKDAISDIHIESWEVPFRESLENCRLYICDHLSTTFIEALAANKPTLLFWNPDVNTLRHEAQPYYDSLKSCGILFDCPEDAALAVIDVYKDVETWWNKPERQLIVNKFCNRFALTSSDTITVWGKELNRIVALPHSKN